MTVFRPEARVSEGSVAGTGDPRREEVAGSRGILGRFQGDGTAHVAVMPIGLVFGAVAATKGLSSLEVMMMARWSSPAVRNSLRSTSGLIPPPGPLSDFRRCSSISVIF